MDASTKPNTVLNCGVHWWFWEKWTLKLYSHPMNFLQNTSVFGNISFFGTYSSDDLGVTCMLHTTKIKLSEYSEVLRREDGRWSGWSGSDSTKTKKTPSLKS